MKPTEIAPPETPLVLAVTGDAPRSCRARANLRRTLSALHLDIHADEIDLTQSPERGLAYGIFATPALVLVDGDDAPHVLYGDLSDEAHLRRFLSGLGNPAAQSAEGERPA